MNRMILKDYQSRMNQKTILKCFAKNFMLLYCLLMYTWNGVKTFSPAGKIVIWTSLGWGFSIMLSDLLKSNLPDLFFLLPLSAGERKEMIKRMYRIKWIPMTVLFATIGIILAAVGTFRWIDMIFCGVNIIWGFLGTCTAFSEKDPGSLLYIRIFPFLSIMVYLLCVEDIWSKGMISTSAVIAIALYAVMYLISAYYMLKCCIRMYGRMIGGAYV